MNHSGGEDVPRIGPNAIIRVGEALTAREGLEVTRRVFSVAALSEYLETPPTEMVPEAQVIALQQALRAQLPADRAAAVAHDAGHRTGDYLLAHRIPKPAQRLLKWLPPPLACRLLLSAVAKNAWTFVGSGHYGFEMTAQAHVSISQCPICRGANAEAPICDFYTGAFERLCRILVSPRVQVRETACQATGAPACRFEIDWSG